MNRLQRLEKSLTPSTPVAEFDIGDTVRVHVKVVEGDKERIQVFQGLVISRSGGANRETFTVRKVSYNTGVERTFPVNSPKLEKIERVRRGRIRRAKLYYLRELRGKAARITERDMRGKDAARAARDLAALEASMNATENADVAPDETPEATAAPVVSDAVDTEQTEAVVATDAVADETATEPTPAAPETAETEAVEPDAVVAEAEDEATDAPEGAPATKD